MIDENESWRVDAEIGFSTVVDETQQALEFLKKGLIRDAELHGLAALGRLAEVLRDIAEMTHK